MPSPNTPPVQRVLMATRAVGGLWCHALELCRALTQRGVRVELATLGAPLSAAQWMEVRDVRGLGLHESLERLEGLEEEASGGNLGERASNVFATSWRRES